MFSIIAFFVLICILVFVHEYGHFWAARKCGVAVLRFSIGFGKVLWRRKDKQGTEFVFSMIPLGGYVQMYNGEDEYKNQIENSRSLNQKTVWQRAFIVIAGPLANILFAIIAYWVVFSIGMPTVKPVIDNVVEQSISAEAGLKPNFEITNINGKDTQNWEDVALILIGQIGSSKVEVKGRDLNLFSQQEDQTFILNLSHWNVDSNKENPLTSLGIRPKGASVEPIIEKVVENSASDKSGLKSGDKIISVNQKIFDWHYLLSETQQGNELEFIIERNNQQYKFLVTPEMSKSDNRYLIGIAPRVKPLEDQYRTYLKYDILTALGKSFAKVTSLVETIFQFIINLITGDLSIQNIGGPISMAKGAGTTAEIGIIYYLGFMALISVNLGIMNLFPILPLDGGQLLILSGELIRGKPLPEKFQSIFQQIGFMLVISLMGFALFNDLIHF
ncbi:RIP metalloprotease RseP [Otariodibacter oris]|uniref:Zinc metalloprotease n=1 Tax=Otariodibacter oris TaxID=1032623 RepID=A0A420XHW1_9PAST|nr:RIP metalloprotease RseP [Otariodibacter oris]QGM80901.1 RIP metalloprotease RseP [Otariodibacter oris]RKR76925.1 regulator of sigma E protease [Otariodibacter oris]